MTKEQAFQEACAKSKEYDALALKVSTAMDELAALVSAMNAAANSAEELFELADSL